MSDETISAEQIEGLEELITKILDSKIAHIPLETEDIEQLKKSPAGTIIRLEEHINALDEKIDEIRAQMVTKAEFAAMESRLNDTATKTEFAVMENRLDNIESKMATKQDLERMATKEEQNVITQELKDLSVRMATKEELNVIAREVKALSVRMEEYDKRLTFFQIVTYSFFGALFAMMVGILLKLFLP